MSVKHILHLQLLFLKYLNTRDMYRTLNKIFYSILSYYLSCCYETLSLLVFFHCYLVAKNLLTFTFPINFKYLSYKFLAEEFVFDLLLLYFFYILGLSSNWRWHSLKYKRHSLISRVLKHHFTWNVSFISYASWTRSFNKQYNQFKLII